MISDKPMKPKIIAFVDDVLFGSQIASAAEGLGFVVEFVGRGEEMGAGGGAGAGGRNECAATAGGACGRP